MKVKAVLHLIPSTLHQYFEPDEPLEFFDSPKGKISLVAAKEIDLRMVERPCFIVDANGNNLTPLLSIDFKNIRSFVQSQESRYLAIHGYHELTLIDLSELSYQCLEIKIKNFAAFEAEFRGKSLFIVSDSSSVAHPETDLGYDRQKPEYPIEIFQVPDPVQVQYEELFEPFPEDGQLQCRDKIELRAKSLGFMPFHGSLPESTAAKINGAYMEVWQLEIFARYGDPVSQK